MSYKKYNWKVVAHDYNSSYLRNHLWVKALFKFPKLLGVSRVRLAIISKNNNIEYLADSSTWDKCHKELQAKISKDYNFVQKLIDKANEVGEKINNWTEKNIYRQDLSRLSNEKLIKLYKQFTDKQGDVYTHGLALPILDFQDFSYVEGNLTKYLKRKVSQKNFAKYYSAFTQPSHNSFGQDQEEALLKLMSKFYKSKKWRDDIKNKNINKLKKLYPIFYKKLSEHTEKYCWVYYVYMGPAFKEQNFLDFIKDYLIKKVDPIKKLKELKVEKQKIRKLKQELIKKLKPDKFNLTIINLAGKVIWAKPHRKDLQSKSYFHVEKLMKEFAKRLYISLEQARSAPIEILEKGLKGKLNLEKINSIYKMHACLPNDNGTFSLLIGKQAEDFSKKQVRRTTTGKSYQKIKSLTGTSACPGHAKGIVKIINLTEDMKKMNYGDILVSTATTPNIVPAMKKAAAIITDEGGLTSHAAIVSRELNTPCIVGLRIATKIFKDGDKVEVDADKGVVRRIK